MSRQSCNLDDSRLVLSTLPWWLRGRRVRREMKEVGRAFINRAYDRGCLTSYNLHELHALLDRVFPVL